MFLDTSALTEFDKGNIALAIESASKALELAQGSGHEAGVEESLMRFKDASRREVEEALVGAR